jgi:diguanylate cyclase (GGDEF)-like protein
LPTGSGAQALHVPFESPKQWRTTMTDNIEYDLLLRAASALSAEQEPAQLARAYVRFVESALGASSAALYDLVAVANGDFCLRPTQGLVLEREIGTERSGSALHCIAAHLLESGQQRCHLASPANNKISQFYAMIEHGAARRQLLAVQGVRAQQHLPLVIDIAALYRNSFALLEENCTDALTGMYNRKPFIARVHEIVEQQTRAAAQDPAFARAHECQLGVIDIDCFKRINDDFGHLIGDEVLLLVARVLRDSFRAGDLLFRFGGEEFVVLLPHTGSEAAMGVFERLREKIAAQVFPRIGRVSISVGYTSVRPGTLPMSFVDEGDRALYHAKQLGRDHVCRFADLAPRGESVCGDRVELFA